MAKKKTRVKKKGPKKGARHKARRIKRKKRMIRAKKKK